VSRDFRHLLDSFFQQNRRLDLRNQKKLTESAFKETKFFLFAHCCTVGYNGYNFFLEKMKSPHPEMDAKLNSKHMCSI
jgi:hypothetical protein